MIFFFKPTMTVHILNYLFHLILQFCNYNNYSLDGRKLWHLAQIPVVQPEEAVSMPLKKIKLISLQGLPPSVLTVNFKYLHDARNKYLSVFFPK